MINWKKFSNLNIFISKTFLKLFEYATCIHIFSKTTKKSPFSKISGYVWRTRQTFVNMTYKMYSGFRVTERRGRGMYACGPFPSSKRQSLWIPVSRFQRLEFLWVSTGNGCHRVLVDKGNEGLGDETRRLPTLGQRGSMRCSETPLTMSGSFQCPWPATGIRSSWWAAYQL